MKTNELSIGVALSALLGGFAALLLTLAWGGYCAGLAASVLWGWFVVPAFGLPAISVAQAYGLALVLRCFRGLMVDGEKEEKGFGYVVARGLLIPPIACALMLGVGWCVKALL